MLLHMYFLRSIFSTYRLETRMGARRSGFSPMKEVLTVPSTKSGCLSTFRRKG